MILYATGIIANLFESVVNRLQLSRAFCTMFMPSRERIGCCRENLACRRVNLGGRQENFRCPISFRRPISFRCLISFRREIP